jgi:hypothetical protein
MSGSFFLCHDHSQTKDRPLPRILDSLFSREHLVLALFITVSK